MKDLVFSYLAHVGRAEIATMRGFLKINIREDSKPAFPIDVAWIGVDLRKTIPDSEMFQYCFDEEYICIANYSQITPELTHIRLVSIQNLGKLKL